MYLDKWEDEKYLPIFCIKTLKKQTEIYIIYSRQCIKRKGKNMGSFVMHIGISEIVRKKLNLSTKFIYGSILPDLIKMETGDRTGTHFLKTFSTKDGIQKLPMVDDAITMLNGKFDKEIRLGYIAHLIEDFIWFEKYIPSFALHLEQGRLVYLKDNTIHFEEEFGKDMYDDYTKINNYIIDKYCNEYKSIKEQLLKRMTKEEKGFLDKNDKLTKTDETDNLAVITKEAIDSYIEETTEKVENIIKELIGE